MKLDAVPQAAQEQFARHSRHYGAGHILADVSDVAAALAGISIPGRARGFFRLAEEDGKTVWWRPRLTLTPQRS